LEGVDAKLVRAREHLRELEKAVAEFLASTKRTIILKLNQDQTAVKLMTWVDDPYPPIRISSIIGDCAYNTRAALDNLVCALVRATNPSSTCSGRRFPVLIEATRWDTSTLAGIPEPARRLIRQAQPFNRLPQSAELDPLFILNTLRNRDTHRATMLTSGFSKNTQFAIHLKTGDVLLVTATRSLFGEGFDEIPLQISPSLLTDETRVKAKGTAVLAFREPGPWEDRAVVDVLETCLRYVEKLITKFHPFFKAK
jgi:hypothetical protein